MESKHYVYMLRCKDQSLYTGYTNDLKARLQKHEAGKGAKYTRGRGPFILEVTKIYETKQEAMKEEYRIKQMSRTQKEKWIAQEREGDRDHESPKKL
ncbi:GIY-YIG nuclease family protein [Halobacillus yeomjeoni]|uniref:GIY-YIG nuclease family protein n=1 Tax=Halobacillus yeomjeoni TaxID=311194 RepID=A0A931MX23_9BACI|nr:GIY-YIG nuclease family protein [Halobacillus yeomjeoni]MBH0231855.1 GIY-YIG nuclease family protein [Halobacillus yeomjeoni]MCA0985650.1 GIY-YIG nuclease family protein [Halobacillus yeomjeoni]